MTSRELLEVLDTPAVFADVDVVAANLQKLQAYCDRHGLANRPHIKTHKSIALARMQVQAGAVGICCQKIGEAEVMAEGGIEDIFIPYPILGTEKLRRLGALAERATISVAVDSAAVAEGISAAAPAAAPIGLLVELYSSVYPRTGVEGPEQALELARIIDGLPNVFFKGLMVFPTTSADVARMNATRNLLEASGLEVKVTSGGGTPEYPTSHQVPGLTEIRTGTYIFHDLRTVGMGVAQIEDCALRVVTTVVSRPAPGRVIIDAGSKTLTNDPDESGRRKTFGYVVEYPNAELTLLSEEHGLIDLPGDAGSPALGERLTIIPNHSSGVVSMHDSVLQVRDGKVVGAWAIEARAKTS